MAARPIAKDHEVEFSALEGSLSMMSKVLNDVLDLCVAPLIFFVVHGGPQLIVWWMCIAIGWTAGVSSRYRAYVLPSFFLPSPRRFLPSPFLFPYLEPLAHPAVLTTFPALRIPQGPPVAVHPFGVSRALHRSEERMLIWADRDVQRLAADARQLEFVTDLDMRIDEVRRFPHSPVPSPHSLHSSSELHTNRKYLLLAGGPPRSVPVHEGEPRGDRAASA
jgi:hypothetical protein